MHFDFVEGELPTDLFDGNGGTGFEAFSELNRAIGSKAEGAGEAIGGDEFVVVED